MTNSTLYWIATEHHTSNDLSTCLVFNPASYSWVSLGKSFNVSGMKAEKANDTASILQDVNVECYIVTGKQLTDMVLRSRKNQAQ